MGYRVDVLEFIDFAHSPKNLMIRSVKTGSRTSLENAKKLLERFNVSQTLYNLVTGDVTD